MIGIQEYKKFDRLVKVGRQQFNCQDAVAIKTAFKLRTLLIEILKPWPASNIAVTMRSFESGVNRVGMPKGHLIEVWVYSIFGHTDHSLDGEMQDVSLQTFVNKLRENYGAKDE